MSNQPDIWTRIDALAKDLGVSEWNRRKWRQRNHVPHRWRLPLIEKSNGTIQSSDIPDRSAA